MENGKPGLGLLALQEGVGRGVLREGNTRCPFFSRKATDTSGISSPDLMGEGQNECSSFSCLKTLNWSQFGEILSF